MKKSAANAIIEQLARENRRVLSGWRAVILLRRATNHIPSDQRRWSQMPTAVDDLRATLRGMEKRGEIKPLVDMTNLDMYEVTVPYARTGLVEADEVLMEVHPYAAVSHLSALVFHNLTDALPVELTVSVPSGSIKGLLPTGTTDEDWVGAALVRGQQRKLVLNRSVRWKEVSGERFFGCKEYQPRGYPVRVTTPERTLLDCLQQPELGGGFDNVLRAWVRACDTLDIDALVSYVEVFGINVLRQRVGFILEELGFQHVAIPAWQGQAKRGGSSKLLASAPYAPAYSERWNLSINASIETLRQGSA